MEDMHTILAGSSIYQDLNHVAYGIIHSKAHIQCTGCCLQKLERRENAIIVTWKKSNSTDSSVHKYSYREMTSRENSILWPQFVLAENAFKIKVCKDARSQPTIGNPRQNFHFKIIY